MISKIIQKEKERQEMFLFNLKNFKESETVTIAEHQAETHKQVLINLKEYLEEVLPNYECMKELIDDAYGHQGFGTRYINQLKEDIAELSKMIERYK